MSAQAAFRAETNLVTVPVVVSQKGRPVAGMAREEFQISCDGISQQVSAFDEIEAGGAQHDTAIVVIDYPNESETFRKGLKKFLPDELREFQSAAVPVTLFVLLPDGLHTIGDLSTAAAYLVEGAKIWQAGFKRESGTQQQTKSAALSVARDLSALLVGDPSVDTGDQERDGARYWTYSELTDLRMRALEQILQFFKAVPDRKKLIWLAGHCPFQLWWSTPAAMRDSNITKPRAIRVWQELTTQNINVYCATTPQPATICHGGVTDFWKPGAYPVDPFTGGTSRSGNAWAEWQDNPPACIKRFLADAPHYYLLGFYFPNPKPGGHKVKVQVKRPGVKVRSRTGFYVGAENVLNDAPESLPQ
jgi:hypothetical protein